MSKTGCGMSCIISDEEEKAAGVTRTVQGGAVDRAATSGLPNVRMAQQLARKINGAAALDRQVLAEGTAENARLKHELQWAEAERDILRNSRFCATEPRVLSNVRFGRSLGLSAGRESPQLGRVTRAQRMAGSDRPDALFRHDAAQPQRLLLEQAPFIAAMPSAALSGEAASPCNCCIASGPPSVKGPPFQSTSKLAGEGHPASRSGAPPDRGPACVGPTFATVASAAHPAWRIRELILRLVMTREAQRPVPGHLDCTRTGRLRTRLIAAVQLLQSRGQRGRPR